MFLELYMFSWYDSNINVWISSGWRLFSSNKHIQA